MRWDPTQYVRYADERGQPFLDLLARVDCPAPRQITDLGCGPGNLTALLAKRWLSALIEGVDSSLEMIERARAAASDRLSFRVADLTSWTMPAGTDVVISNAALQWVPSHRSLLRSWAAALSAGGWLAFQVPGNFDAPSHALMRELAASPRWSPLVGSALRHADAVDSPSSYAGLLLDAGLSVQAWETTYLHLLHGADPVLEWVRGTGLRPILAALSPEDAAEFEAEYGAALRAAYPRGPHGTLFPFRRIFVVAHKPVGHKPIGHKPVEHKPVEHSAVEHSAGTHQAGRSGR